MHNSLAHTLQVLFDTNLQKLIQEIDLYENEDDIWRVEKDIANSAGNLALHLIGNLNTYIGKELGKTNYVRDRELEFAARNIPRHELVENIQETRMVVKNALLSLTAEDLKKEFPVRVLSQTTTTEYLLVHLAMHLTYHLGQINYHRRLI